MNHGLCWLGVAKNRLQRVSHLQNLSSLAVLDVSDNKMSRCPNQQHRRICFRSAQLPVEVSYNKYIYIYSHPEAGWSSWPSKLESLDCCTE